jgi:hypothetical protein
MNNSFFTPVRGRKKEIRIWFHQREYFNTFFHVYERHSLSCLTFLCFTITITRDFSLLFLHLYPKEVHNSKTLAVAYTVFIIVDIKQILAWVETFHKHYHYTYREINVREYRKVQSKMANPEKTGNIGYSRRRNTKQKTNTKSVGHHHTQKNTNSVHKS